MYEIKVREVWRNGDEVGFAVEAWEPGIGKMFSPGARVRRERKGFKQSTPLTVVVGWGSSSNTGKLEEAKAQLAVLTKAIELAEDLAAERPEEEPDLNLEGQPEFNGAFER